MALTVPEKVGSSGEEEGFPDVTPPETKNRGI